MSFNIDEMHVREYEGMLTMKVQQMSSKLRRAVTIESIGSEGKRFDLLDTTDAETDKARHSDAMVASPDHEGRWLFPHDIHWGTLIDTEDKARSLADPNGPYLRAGAAAVGRQIDKYIIDALEATVTTGKTGTGTSAFDSTYSIAVDYVESGSPVAADSLLTIAKLRRAMQIFGDADVPEEDEFFWVSNAKGKQDLLATTEVTSSDYNTVKALVNGEINTFMGFNFIWLNGSIAGTKILPLVVATDIVTNYAFARSGVKWGELEGGIRVNVSPRPDKKGIPDGLQVNAGGNGLRYEDEKVIRCYVDNSP